MPDGSLPVGTTLGAYVLERCIGTGGMGEVYEATHVGLKKRVALKALRRQAAESTDARTRFLREGELASKIRHPNVVDITDVGETAGIAYLVMEYLEGESLADLLRREGPQPAQHVVDIMLPVIAAVSAAHEHGVIHRDLKPENVFLTRDALGELQPKVLDFGISKAVNDPGAPQLTVTSSFIGTPYYMSPEQAMGSKDIDERSDQYAVGVLLYEGVTGRRPHVGNETFMQLMHAISKGTFPPPSAIRPGLAPDLEAIILRAMAIRREARFVSLKELGGALLPFASERIRAVWKPVFHAFTDPNLPVVAPATDGRGAPAPAPTPAGTPVPTVDRSGAVMPAYTYGSTLATTSGAARVGSRYGAVALAVSAGLLVLLVAAGAIAWALVGRGQPAPPAASGAVAPSKYEVAVTTVPPGAVIELDGAKVGAGSFRTKVDLDGRDHTLRVRADGFRARTVTFKDAPPPAVVELRPVEDGAPEARAESTEPEKAPRRVQKSTPPAAHEGKRIEKTEPAEEPHAPEPPQLKTDNIDPWNE